MKRIKLFWLAIFFMMASIFLLAACGGGGGDGGGGAGVGSTETLVPISTIGTNQTSPVIFTYPGQSTIILFGVKQDGQYVYTDEVFMAELVGGDGTNLLRYPNGVDSITLMNWFIVPAPADGQSSVYEISSTSGSFLVYVETNIDSSAGYQSAEIVVDISGGGEVSGHVRDSVDQLPVYRALELVNNSTGAIQWTASDTTTGDFSFTGVDPGEYTLRALYPEWNVEHTYMFPGRETEIQVTVQ